MSRHVFVIAGTHREFLAWCNAQGRMNGLGHIDSAIHLSSPEQLLGFLSGQRAGFEVAFVGDAERRREYRAACEAMPGAGWKEYRP